jgi:hypothetical protein
MKFGIGQAVPFASTRSTQKRGDCVTTGARFPYASPAMRRSATPSSSCAGSVPLA